MQLFLSHQWFFAVFWFCAALVLANGVHYVLFRLLRRKEVEGGTLGWGLQRHLGRPARAIFLMTCLVAVLPAVPKLPDNVEDLVRQIAIMALIVAIGWFAVGCVYVMQTCFSAATTSPPRTTSGRAGCIPNSSSSAGW